MLFLGNCYPKMAGFETRLECYPRVFVMTVL